MTQQKDTDPSRFNVKSSDNSIDSEEVSVTQLCLGQVGQKRQRFQKRIKTCVCGAQFVLQAGSNSQRKYCYTCNPFGAKGLPTKKQQKMQKQQSKQQSAVDVSVVIKSQPEEWGTHKSSITKELTSKQQETTPMYVSIKNLLFIFPVIKLAELNLKPDLLWALSMFKSKPQQNSHTNNPYFRFPQYTPPQKCASPQFLITKLSASQLITP